MKIGYFAGHFPYKDLADIEGYAKRYAHDGGVNVAHNLAVNMAKRGNGVSVFTTSISSKNSTEEYGNMKVYRHGTNFRVESVNISLKLFKDPMNYQVDIVHAHVGVPSASTAAIWYAKRKKKPLVITYHGDAQEDFGSSVRKIGVSFYNKYVLDKIFSAADVIISPSEYYINESRFLGKYRDKTVAIANGVNVENFDIPDSKEECRKRLGLPLDGVIILFVGQLTPYKGPDVLVRAMPAIVRNIPNVRLVFVGSGEMGDELKYLSEKLGVDKYIEFAGFVEENLKPLYYKSADVFVLPSSIKMEVFPIVFLEASASGLPMIVSNLDTFKCIIEDGYNGIVTKRGDENDLADALIYILENVDVRVKMGMDARKKVEEYSWEKIAEETECLYRRLI